LNINGKVRDVRVEDDHAAPVGHPRACRPDRYKYGCGVAQCGACSVHINGE